MPLQIGTSPSYLIRNPYSYCFRIRVPPDIQCYLGKKELRYSLKTGYLSEARPKAMILGGKYKQLFKWVRHQSGMGKMTDQEIQEIVDCFVGFAGDADLWEGFEDTSKSLNPERLRDKIFKAKDMAYEYKNAAETGSFSQIIKVENLVDHILEHTVENPPAKSSPEYKVICQKAAEAIRDKWDSYHKHHVGRLTGATNAVGGGTIPSHREPIAPASEVVTLKTILDEHKKRNINWKDAAVEAYDRYTRRLLQHFDENTPIGSIDYKAMERFRDELKETGMKGKPVKVKTVNLYLDFYSSVFNHAIRSNRITHNPVHGTKFNDDRNQQELNDPFTKEDLIKLFHSKRYKKDNFKHGWMFWLPILSLYTGARIEELCQMYIDDIKPIDGIWLIEINGNHADQRVKTYEKRCIPLHPFIRDELRFAEYAHRLPDQSGRVFPELKRTGKKRPRYGHGPSTNWFPRYKKGCGIVAEKGKKGFHSFRHNVSYCLMKHDVQEYVISMFMGHEHEQISTGRYGKKFDHGELMEKAVMKLDYDIDLSHLPKSKYVPK